MSGADILSRILDRKRIEVGRRARHRRAFEAHAARFPLERGRGERALAAIRRGDGAALPRVIAEVKFQSPSAGTIRERAEGLGARIARGYVEGGASAVSVLADGPGFGGSALEVRRVASAIEAPVLFKEFVLDPIQVELARVGGASMVLLLVRALDPRSLRAMIAEVRARGMEPVVEAADEAELEIALETEARIVGVNARDLRTFRLDPEAAARAMARIPADRVAVFMSGIRTREDVDQVARTRADAILVGEGLMRAPDPGARLAQLLGGT